jgi:tetrahydromethanopterin S-methyltransferase subunit A
MNISKVTLPTSLSAFVSSLRFEALRLSHRTIGRVVDWPPAPGHFIIGNAESAVAVCTLSSTALISQLNPRFAAIIGRVYTPNIGIEKMIRNVVSNPKLRYLVVCGKESPVFKVGEAILALSDYGVDEAGHIIGASQAQAELKNLPSEVVTRFREQISLVNLMGETSPNVIDKTLAEYTARQTPAFTVSGLTMTEMRLSQDAPLIEMQAHRREWLTLDPLSYFFISVDREQGELALERYTPADHKLTHVIRGRAADVIYHTVIREKLLTQLDHAAYLGAELAKAETALYNNLPYEQDKKLFLPKDSST